MRAIFTLVLGLLIHSMAMAETDPGPATKLEDMQAYSLNGFQLSGAEYWVFVAGREFKYPDDVLWGFQGEDGTAGPAPLAARECAMVAYNKLNQFLRNPPSRFVELKDKGATPRFFLWTNDYTQAATNEEERPNRFWHWNRGNKDYAAGYWKWESTLTRDAKCTIPDDAQIADMIEKVHQAMGQ